MLLTVGDSVDILLINIGLLIMLLNFSWYLSGHLPSEFSQANATLASTALIELDTLKNTGMSLLLSLMVYPLSKIDQKMAWLFIGVKTMLITVSKKGGFAIVASSALASMPGWQPQFALMFGRWIGLCIQFRLSRSMIEHGISFG